jgi:hypothetical protein
VCEENREKGRRAATEVSWELSRVDAILLLHVFIVSFLYL